MAENDEAVIAVGRLGEAFVVRLLHPDPASSYAHKLRTALYGLADYGHALRVVLDLREYTHVPSSTLGIFIMFNRKLQTNAGMLRLCCLSPIVQAVFTKTQLDKHFSIYESVENATAGW
jgi:anti-anti-sigma factor